MHGARIAHYEQGNYWTAVRPAGGGERLILDPEEFYLLISSETYLDLFDQVFAQTFRGVAVDSAALLANLDAWLKAIDDVNYDVKFAFRERDPEERGEGRQHEQALVLEGR